MHLSAKTKWTLGVFLFGATTLLGSGYLILAHIADGLCENEIARAFQSADGRYTAYIFHRDCGSTTHTSTQIAVLASSESLPNDPGNVFRAESSQSNPGEPVTGARWTGPRTLEIRYIEASRLFAQEKQYRDVNIRYVAD